jgi:2-dehydro-3-deoxyphosphooctonate aldolase (KDO 8-P synthase)
VPLSEFKALIEELQGFDRLAKSRTAPAAVADV